VSVSERIAARPLLQRRALALTLLLVLLGGLWIAAWEPLHWMVSSQDHWRGEMRRQLAHARGEAAIEPQLRQRLHDVEQAPLWKTLYEETPGRDTNSLVQADLTVLCTSVGAKVQAVAPLPRMREGRFTGYGVRGTTVVTAEQLRALIGALRTHPRYLRVEHLTVTAPQLQLEEDNAELTVTIEIYGYALATAVKSP
jgi:hypothetical protein